MTGFMIAVVRVYLFLCLVLDTIYTIGMLKVGRGLEAYLLVQLAVLCAVVLVPYQVKMKVDTEKKGLDI